MNILKKQIVGFLIAGVLANFVSFTFYIILYKKFNLSILISSIFDQCIGVFTNYLINSRFVFKKSLNFKMKAFYIIYYALAIYVVGKIIESFTLINIEYRIAWFLAIFIACISNFLFIKFIAFRN